MNIVLNIQFPIVFLMVTSVNYMSSIKFILLNNKYFHTFLISLGSFAYLTLSQYKYKP